MSRLQLGYPGVCGRDAAVVVAPGEPGGLASGGPLVVVDREDLVGAVQVAGGGQGLAGRVLAAGRIQGRPRGIGQKGAGGPPVACRGLQDQVVAQEPEHGAVADVVLDDCVVPVEHGHSRPLRVEAISGATQLQQQAIQPLTIVSRPRQIGVQCPWLRLRHTAKREQSRQHRDPSSRRLAPASHPALSFPHTESKLPQHPQTDPAPV